MPAAREEAGRTPALRRRRLVSGEHDRGYLPHWKAEAATYFVTFRLAGTLPAKLLQAYEEERRVLIARAQERGDSMSTSDQNRLRELRSQRIEAYLDAGHGPCWLKDERIAELVAGALRHFDGRRYELHAWVVMPNHLHVVVCPLEDRSLSEILHSWKSYTATRANRLLNRKGKPFWQPESYDHLVRDEKDYERVCTYTLNNPVNAGLCRNPEDWPYSSAFVR